MAGCEHGLEAARLGAAWAHGVVAMELAGAGRMGGDIDSAFTFGIDRIGATLASTGAEAVEAAIKHAEMELIDRIDAVATSAIVRLAADNRQMRLLDMVPSCMLSSGPRRTLRQRSRTRRERCDPRH